MPSYVPIMKSRPAELDAWARRTAAVTATATPLFEIAFEPTERRPKIEHYLAGLLPTLVAVVGAGNTVIVDGVTIDQTVPAAHTTLRFVPWLSRELLAAGVRYVPVIHVDDPDVVIQDAGDAARAHGGGVVVRLGSETVYPDLATFPGDLADVLRLTSLPVSEINVLLDYQSVLSSSEVTAAISNANPWLTYLAGGGFRSVHVAAGGFPASISHLKVASDNRLRRYDADLYTGLAIPAGLNVGYADFLINHPSTARSVKRSPLPGLRYTAGNEWLVWREQRALPGNESFFTVCANVAGSPVFAGAGHSWGDAEVALRASTPVPKGVGPGGAKQWRAYGSAHHVQTVVDRLTTLGAP